MLDCDGRIYTGVAVDPQRRYQEHLAGKTRAAKFTRSANCITLVYQVCLGPRGLALKAEARITKLSRAKKLAVIEHSLCAGELLGLLGLALNR